MKDTTEEMLAAFSGSKIDATPGAVFEWHQGVADVEVMKCPVTAELVVWLTRVLREARHVR